MMQISEALLTRRTVHAYTKDPVPEDALARALDAARYAPNHGLTFPWRFTRPGPVGRDAIAELYVRLKQEASSNPLSSAKRQRYFNKVRDPAVLLVVSQVRSEDPFRAREDYASVAAAIQNLHLSVHADGLGAKWSTGGVTHHSETYAICSIDPAVEEIVGFVWVGVPRTVPQVAERPPLSTLVRTTP
jgi:nitroreductase